MKICATLRYLSRISPLLQRDMHVLCEPWFCGVAYGPGIYSSSTASAATAPFIAIPTLKSTGVVLGCMSLMANAFITPRTLPGLQYLLGNATLFIPYCPSDL